MKAVAHRSSLRIVKPDPEPASNVQHDGRDATRTEALLIEIVPQLLEAEEAVRRFRNLLRTETRLLAQERGVAFIREESVRREFGQ